MKILLTGTLLIMIAISCKNSPSSYSDERKEIQAFLDNYKQLLRNAKFDSVALLYVDTGFISNGNATMAIQNIDTIKAFYSRFPKVQNDFTWTNTRIDILSNQAALVNSLFLWHDKNATDTSKLSYTGIFVKLNNTWKIMSEHESIDAAALMKQIQESERKK